MSELHENDGKVGFVYPDDDLDACGIPPAEDVPVPAFDEDPEDEHIDPSELNHPTDGLNFEGLDKAQSDEVWARASKGLACFFEFLSGRSRSRLFGSPEHIRCVGLRAIAVIWCIRPELLGSPTQHALSLRLGVTDTILSRYATEFRDKYNFKAPAQRSETTRARMRNAKRPTSGGASE